MKIYFASDIHLGAPSIKDHRAHEMRFVRFLESIENDADELFLLGDIFDYWFEYKSVAPKGFVRFLGKISQMTDKGIKVHFFTGNHDVWMWDYLEKECGVEVHHKHCEIERDGRRLFIGHGDGLGNYDRGYNLLKWIFENRVAQFLYSMLHPNFANWIATTWSGNSRKRDDKNTKFHTFRNEEEHQVMFARKQISEGKHFDYYVFGHRHVEADYPLNDATRLIVLGQWMSGSTYAVMTDGKLELMNA